MGQAVLKSEQSSPREALICLQNFSPFPVKLKTLLKYPLHLKPSAQSLLLRQGLTQILRGVRQIFGLVQPRAGQFFIFRAWTSGSFLQAGQVVRKANKTAANLFIKYFIKFRRNFRQHLQNIFQSIQIVGIHHSMVHFGPEKIRSFFKWLHCPGGII